MNVDEQGLVWISDPWIAVIAIAAVIGLFLWCQLRLARESAARSATVSVRADPMQAGRTARSRSGATPVTCRTTACADSVHVRRRRVA